MGSFFSGRLTGDSPADGMRGKAGRLSPYYLINWVEGAHVPVAGVVGRDRELAAVAAFLDAVPSGPCGLVLEGAAGIGKTTVWRAGAAWAAGRSYTVLSCRPVESEATLSFAALGDLLDGVLDRVLAGLPSPQRRALEVALLLEDPGASPPEQRAACVAFLAVIRHLSAAGPVVLAIDDLQWLDVASATVVEFGLRRLRREKAGLLASVRDLGDGRSAAAGTGPPAERLTRLQVGPLTLGAFQAALRASAGAGLSRLTIQRLFEASGGNPFYGLELARTLHRAGAEPAPEDPLPVPAGPAGVLSARLAALPADAREVLLAAACDCGHPQPRCWSRRVAPRRWLACGSRPARRWPRWRVPGSGSPTPCLPRRSTPVHRLGGANRCTVGWGRSPRM